MMAINDSIKIKYQMLTQMLRHEGQLVWTRYSLFLAAHSLLITALINLYLAAIKTKLVDLVEWFCGLGMILCLLWSIVTLHGINRCSHWRTKIRNLEGNHNNLPKFPTDNKILFCRKCNKIPIIGKIIDCIFKGSRLLNMAAIAVIYVFLIIYWRTWRATSKCDLSDWIFGICLILIFLLTCCYYKDAQKAKSSLKEESSC